MAKATTKSTSRSTAKPKTTPRKNKTRPGASAPTLRASRSATPAAGTSSKSAIIIGLLDGREGASIEDLVHATGWQKHSIRGFLSGTLGRKRGITVTSELVDGIRRYRAGDR